MPDQFKEVSLRCVQGELSTRQAADLLGVCHTTFYRKYRKLVEETVSKGRHLETSR